MITALLFDELRLRKPCSGQSLTMQGRKVPQLLFERWFSRRRETAEQFLFRFAMSKLDDAKFIGLSQASFGRVRNGGAKRVPGTRSQFLQADCTNIQVMSVGCNDYVSHAG